MKKIENRIKKNNQKKLILKKKNAQLLRRAKNSH